MSGRTRIAAGRGGAGSAYLRSAPRRDGGDEVFAGYERYGIQQKRERFAAIPPALSRLYRRHLFPLMPKGMRGRQLSYNLSLPWRERYADEMCFIPAFEREMPLLTP